MWLFIKGHYATPSQRQTLQPPLVLHDTKFVCQPGRLFQTVNIVYSAHFINILKFWGFAQDGKLIPESTHCGQKRFNMHECETWRMLTHSEVDQPDFKHAHFQAQYRKPPSLSVWGTYPYYHVYLLATEVEVLTRTNTAIASTVEN